MAQGKVGKGGSTGSAEPNYFQILCQICPGLQIVTKFTKFNRICTKFDQVYNLFKTKFVIDVVFFLWFQMRVIYVFPPNLYPQQVRVDKKNNFFQLWYREA